MFKRDKTERLKSNIKYLIKSRGETQQSLSNACGVTRTTIYNILEGRVVNAQQSTIRKISDFFGVSYKEIETVSFEDMDVVGSGVLLMSDMNPTAVPIVKERFLMPSIDKKIGELVATHPLTYYFGSASNLIGVLLENRIEGANESGDILIVKRRPLNNDNEKLVCNTMTKSLFISRERYVGSETLTVIGEVVEERFYEQPVL